MDDHKVEVHKKEREDEEQLQEVLREQMGEQEMRKDNKDVEEEAA